MVTQHAFRVHPELLGRPLAGPLRRLAGMLTDLFLLGLIFPLKLAAGALLGGIADGLVLLGAAWILWRLGSGREESPIPNRAVRWTVRTASFVVLLVGAGSVLGDLGEGGTGDAPDPGVAVRESLRTAVTPSAAASGSAERPAGEAGLRTARRLSLREVLQGVGEGLALARVDSRDEAQPAADRLALKLHRMGVPPEVIADELEEELAADTARPWLGEVVRNAVARVDSLRRVEQLTTDSLVQRYRAARSAGDTSRVGELRLALRQKLAGDDLSRLRRENRELQERVRRLTRRPGVVQRARAFFTEDLGISLPWVGVYFVLFLVVWDGRTPGKRLWRMRVVRLDGEPLGWWGAFERFAGYFAGLATGLLGFLQILWDPNRQGIHDKIVGTVVIKTGTVSRPVPRELRQAVAGPRTSPTRDREPAGRGTAGRDGGRRGRTDVGAREGSAEPPTERDPVPPGAESRDDPGGEP